MEPAARPYLLLEDADRRLCEVNIAEGQARYNLGQIEQALENTLAAERLAKLVRDPRLQSKVGTELGIQLRHVGRSEDSEKALRMAIEKAEEAGDQTETAKWWGTRYTKAEFHERLNVVRSVQRQVLAPAGHMLHHDSPKRWRRISKRS